jgi:WD40 repeat protein
VLAVAVGELDGRAIAVSAGGDETVRVWDLANQIPLCTISIGQSVTSLAARESAIVVGTERGILMSRLRHSGGER